MLRPLRFPHGVLCSLAAISLLAGMGPTCGPEYNMGATKRQTAALEELAGKGDFSAFLASAKSVPLYNSSKNELVESLDFGLAMVFEGDYKGGAKRLAKVGDISETHYTKSITRQVLSILANDLALPYYGKDYEVSFSSNLSALAYAAAGERDDALVEARRAEHILSLMSDSYEGSDKYSDDAFSHYLAGLLYESAGSYDDARISFAHAKEAYGGRFFPMKPKGLTEALGRSASFDDSDGAVGSGSGITENADSRERGHMIVSACTGKGPSRDEAVMRAHFTDDGIDYLIKVAIPVLNTRESRIRAVRLRLGDKSYPLDCVADYNTIATHNFNDRQPMMFAKTVARVSARYLIMKESKEKTVRKLKEKHEKAKEKHGDDSDEAGRAWIQMKAAALALDMIANELLEHADTRCSLLLPERIWCSRVPVPDDGSVNALTLEYLDVSGNIIGKEKQEFALEENGDGAMVKIFSALY